MPYSYDTLTKYIILAGLIFSILILIKDKNKIKRAMPGLIVGSIMTGIVIWGISSNKNCEKLLKKDNCIEQVVLCEYSHNGWSGHGPVVKTGFKNPQDTSFYFNTESLIKPIPLGTPIIVRYSPDCIECYQFIWDSVLLYNNHRIKYFYVNNEGMDYKIID